MMRGTPDHPKTTALMVELGLPRYAVVGLLESLWHFAARYAPRGDVGRYTPDQLAKHLDWDGDPVAMVDALIKSGWVDRHRRHKFLVHDWPDHAQDSVHVWLARHGERFANGTVPSMRRLNFKERAELAHLFRAHKARNGSAIPLAVKKANSLKEGMEERAREEIAPPPPINPLVTGRRGDLETETLTLCSQIAEEQQRDPAEVLSQASEYRGRSKVNPASMSDDRLLNTVLRLRRMAAGEPPRAPPAAAPSDKAQAREANAMAMVKGGMREERSMGQGNGAAGDEPPGQGPHGRHGNAPRGLLPPAPRPPRR